MANPEQGPPSLGTVGVWQSVGVVVPDFLDPLRQDISTFFGFLADLLQVLSKALEIGKVFASGQLDPLVALVQKIRDQIEALLINLRELGVYIHGDFYLLEGPDASGLVGGFPAYEARMTARLLDLSDPNRPNFPPEIATAAVFLYASADVLNLQRIFALIQALAALFNRSFPPARLQNTPIALQATYGYDGATIFSFNKSFFRGFRPSKGIDNPKNPYNAVNLTWEMAPLPGNSLANVARIPPAGFLVEVSTIPTPIPLLCERPIQGALEGVQYPDTPPTREVVEILDEAGVPVALFGGAEEITFDDSLSFNSPDLPDQIKIYGLASIASGAAIPLEDLREGDKHFLQRTFFVPFLQNVFFPGRRYGTTLLFKDMPFQAEWAQKDGKVSRTADTSQPSTFYVRVRAVTRAIQSTTAFSYSLDSSFVRDQSRRPKPTCALEGTVTLADRSPPSQALTINFPDASTEKFLRALAEALAILVLCRTDLSVLLGKTGPISFPPLSGEVLPDGRYDPYWSTYEGQARLSTGLEEAARILLPRILGHARTGAYFSRAVSPTSFRRSLLTRCITTTNYLFQTTSPPQGSRQIAVDRAEDLLNFRVNLADGISTSTDPTAPGLSLLEWLAEDDPLLGVALNPTSLGIVGDRAVALAERQTWSLELLPRGPHFFSTESSPGRGKGSVDTSPVLYTRQNASIQDMAYVRNLVPDEVYAGAAEVLRVALGPLARTSERGWIALRLFPQSLPNVNQFLDQVLALLQTVQEALDSLANTIDQYIEFLQAKIAELQAFLNRLEAILNQLLRFFAAIKPAAGLIVLGNGTQGILEGLQSASNKPKDTNLNLATAYGGGVVFVVGGVPTVALNLFLSLFQGDG